MPCNANMRIRKFDPNNIKPHRIVFIIGKRGTGKSVLQRDLMYHQSGRVDFGVAMSPTEEAIQTFQRHMPDAWIYRQFQQDKIADIINVQRKTLKSTKEPKSLFLVLDDCLYDKRIMRTREMRDIFMNGRHLKLSVSIACQYLLDLPPDLRAQIDYIIVTRDMILANKMKLYKYFFGMFERYEDFAKTMDKCTENFGVLVMDNTVQSSNIEDCIFWYKARIDLPDFKMGKETYWRLAEKYNKTERDRELEEHAKQQEAVEIAHAKRGRLPLVVHVADERGNLINGQSVLHNNDSSSRSIDI